MIIRENTHKPQISYWEHADKSHQCNHYECNGTIKIRNIIHRDSTLILAHGYCEECGQRYLIGEAPEWFNQKKEESKPVMQKVAPVQREERRSDTTAEINRLIKGILTV